MVKSRKFLSGVLSAMLVLSGISTNVYAEEQIMDETGSEAVAALNEQIAALPESLLGSTDIAKDYENLLAIKAAYEALSEEEKAEVDFTKAETLLDFNSDTLNPENLEKGNSLEGKVIGYLGSSITQGFRSDGVAFPEYIAQLSGSTTIKQAIPGGTLALKEGYREEVCYINQLLDGALTDVEHLDALVVQLSTNDVGAGIPIGEVSESFASEDQDYKTIIGAMEYITAYAKEKWDCPVMFYINAYLSDEACEAFANGDEATLKVLHEQYQDMYEQMIDALYQVVDKWDLGVADLWNDEYVRSASLDLRNFFMDDPIHPHKAGYYFWYTQPIMAELVRVIDEASQHVFTYDAAAAGKTSDYSSVSSPSFIIYPGVLEHKSADDVMEELGVKAIADQYAGKVTVVTPADGKEYGEADAKEFVDLLGFAVSNAKVIGLDEGATFVNNYVSQACWAVSGIMTYGGEMNEGLTYDVAVPVYLSNPSETAKAYYTRVNASEELGIVECGTEATAAEAFTNAWNKVFKKVYRQHNELTEFYNIPASAITDPYPLITSVIDMETEYGVNYYPHYYEPLNGEGRYCWFEYIPQATLEMEEGTVPLVVTLHGNGNDARIQGETTGWVELAAEENFMVVAPEWQSVALVEGTSDTKPNFFNCDGLEKDKLIEWIEMLEEKYPQIDKSRIYVTGLSAGASASTLYGALYNDFFAGAAAVSGPGVDKDELAAYVENYDGNEMPWMYLCGDHDFFGMLPVDGSSPYSFEVAPGVHIQDVDPASSMFSFIQSYQKINGLEVSEAYDMSLNEYYGIKLENEEWFKLGFKDALAGSLSNEKGEMIRLVAIKNQAHWNYKPEAAYIWDFFRNYSRNTETGELEIAEKFEFDDVADPERYFYEPVYWAYNHKPQITKGTSEHLFSPDANVTRGQMVTFLWRLAGEPEPEGEAKFNDVKADRYFAKAIAWAAENEITTGYADGSGNFGPDDNCTREQIVTFLWRYAKKPAAEKTAEFTDTRANAYYLDALSWAAENEITLGLNDGTGRFGVGMSCTRAMAVTFLYRASVR